ncbi:CHAT domain-containing protein [Streptomyces sp. NPDC127091]|uniref:CHAT domain-containing protein n=1 Tax=Streptomyces sp. NPDC127091 TaxID=3347134 RepID=UPI003661B496
MPTQLPVHIIQNPSDGFRRLPHLEASEPDLRVSFDLVQGDRIRARMSGPALQALRIGEHRADLAASPNEVRASAARLRRRWKEVLVDHQPVDGQGRAMIGRQRPYSSSADLSGESEEELRKALNELTRSGASLLFEDLLGGDHDHTIWFRTYLSDLLSRKEGLRIRFDSDTLHLPWPMLCLEPDGSETLDDLFARFLGYRHQIEHTGDAYPSFMYRPLGSVTTSRSWFGQWRNSEASWFRRLRNRRAKAAVSLNHDPNVGIKTRAREVAAALARGTHYTERTTYDHLVGALEQEDLDEQLMYFWCHAEFVSNSTEPPRLAIRLSDAPLFDGHTVRELRARYRRVQTPFRPFVVLNTCYGGVPAGDGDRAFLGRRLIEYGAQGVLGPQIEMPQMFAAEYALEFVTRFLRGKETAGKISHDLARHFATRYRNPLGCAYALHCGMDARMERAQGVPGDHDR